MLTDLKTHYQFFNTICDLNDEYPDNKDFIEHIQKELFSNIIYVFDENGNAIELAKGSTIIDFAYKTKKDFVNVVLGAYVNNNLVGPNYILTNNDRVSLLYNKNKSLSLKKWDESIKKGLGFKTNMCKEYVIVNNNLSSR